MVTTKKQIKFKTSKTTGEKKRYQKGFINQKQKQKQTGRRGGINKPRKSMVNRRHKIIWKKQVQIYQKSQ